ncbi:hypothetical protein [Paenibacillus sp. OSY-SE]|uniref:hypothetical protein n=1 Tax=Paenibacillus sp. OSY-SE TaxID=1196323 RepID=UPI0002FC2E7B|nr:hypothetical protein [Paenibacillus sp. OSY-SE]
MAEKEFYRLDLVIGTNGVEDTEKQVKAIDKMLEQTARRASALGKSRITPTARLEDRISSPAKKVTATLSKIDKTVAKPEARLVDKVSGAANKVSSTLTSLVRKPYNVLIFAKDMATGTIKKIMGALTSPLALLGAGGGVAGVTTVGLNMVMQEQGITSAFKVLLGSAEKAQKRVQELTTFAGQTPYRRDEIYEASRVLEVFTKGAISTGDGLKMVGDISAGTQNDFANTALWIGRLYDALEAGRPVGEMTSRLQEMGAMSGAARAGLEKIAESGLHISKTWPLVVKEFSRFDGMMEDMSGNLHNLLLGTKTFFTQNVFKRWGMGLEGVLSPALKKFRQWRSENKETIAILGQNVEEFGKKIGTFVIGGIEKVTAKFNELSKDPAFQNADIFGKIRIAWDEIIAKPFTEWWAGSGETMFIDMSAKMGKTLGGGLKGFIMGALGLFTSSDKLSDDGTFTAAGVTAGEAFFRSFIDAFDAGAIAEKTWEAFKNIQPPWLGGESSGILGNVLSLGFDAWLLSKAYKILKGPATGGKKIWDWAKGWFGGGKGGPPSPPTGGTSLGKPPTPSNPSNPSKPLQKSPGPYEKGWQPPRTTETHPPKKVSSPYKPGNIPNFAKMMAKWAPYIAAGLSVYDIATAEPGEERAKAVGSNAGGWIGAFAGFKAGAAAGSIVPGYGNLIGGLLGMGLGAFGGSKLGGVVVENSEAMAEWIGKFTAPKFSNSSEKIRQEFMERYKDNPRMLEWGALPTSERYMSFAQSSPKAPISKEEFVNGVPSDTVKISEDQVSQMMAYLQDFKKEVTNDIRVTIPPGAVQINMPTQEIDYKQISNDVGWRVASAVQMQMMNRK